jgi:hypothetical protein
MTLTAAIGNNGQKSIITAIGVSGDVSTQSRHVSNGGNGGGGGLPLSGSECKIIRLLNHSFC